MAITRMGTGTSNLGANVTATEHDAATFVETLREKVRYAPLGRRDDIPRNDGKTVRWNFFSNPSGDTATLTEGNDPGTSTDFTTTPITATLAEYGGVTEYSKFLDLAALSGTREEFVKGLAHRAALSVDLIIEDALDEATNTNDEGAAMSAEGLRKAVIELLANNAMPHPRSPGGQFFIFVGSVEQCYDVIGEGAPAWFQARTDQLTSSMVNPLQDSVPTAAIYNCIMQISTNIVRVTTTSPDDDVGYLFGKDAFGISSLDSDVMSPRIIITTPEQLVSAPLRNRGTAGYWFLFASKIIDNNRFIEMVSDATGIG
jgi:hypothetical protein